MISHYRGHWLSALVVVSGLMALPMRSSAFVMSLGEGFPESPGAVPNDGGDVLYATDRDGREVKLAETNAPLGEAVPLDLGAPSIGPDGTVFFGAAFRRNIRMRWDIFAANPDNHRKSLIAIPTSSGGSALEIITDPTPLGQGDGSVIFGAHENPGGDGVYRLKNGNLSCLVRTGARLTDGRVLRNIAFGSFSAGGDGKVAVIGYLTPTGKAELLVSNRKITVLAAAGEKAPDGARYQDLGLPAVSGVHGEKVAFAAVTNRGGGVYAYTGEKIRVALTTGAPCSNGKITFISQGRVGLNSEGAIVVGGTCSRAPAIFLVKDSQARMIVSAQRKSDHSGFVDVRMPSLFETGAVRFSASTGAGSERLYWTRPDSSSSNTAGPVLPLIPTSNPNAPPLHTILMDSITGDEHGRLAYLGGPIVNLASGQTE